MNTYIFIHGGESFLDHDEYMDFISSILVNWNIEPFSIKEEKKKWKVELANKLAKKGHRVYMPNFPNTINTHYDEWRLFFDTWITKAEIVGTVTLIGHSLGGNFLLKYFGEVIDFPHEIEAVHLIASCISCGDFSTPINYGFLQKLGNRVHIWHAADDSVVPFCIGQDIAQNLPNAETHFFGIEKGYGHFHGIERFPDIENVILGYK